MQRAVAALLAALAPLSPSSIAHPSRHAPIMLWDNSLKAVEGARVLHLTQHVCHFMLEQRALAGHASVQHTDGFSAPLHA